MPTTIPIAIANISPAASAVSVTNVVRSDTQAPPVGITLPIALTFSAPDWIGSFTDTLVPASYTATATLTENDVVSLPFSWTISSPGGAVGQYWSQALVISVAKTDAVVWSQIDNNSTGPDQERFQTAGDSVDTVIDGVFMDEFYSTPIPPTCRQFKRICEIAVKLVVIELYMFPRGMRDSDQVGGQLANLRAECYTKLDKILSRPVTGTGVTRNFPSPAILVPSDCAGNPRPAVSNSASPELYPPWFWGFGGAPFGLW